MHTHCGCITSLGVHYSLIINNIYNNNSLLSIPIYSVCSYSPNLHWFLQEDVSCSRCILGWFGQSDWLGWCWPGDGSIPCRIYEKNTSYYTAAIWWPLPSQQANKMQSTYLSVSSGTKWRDVETDLLVVPKGHLITAFVSISIYSEMGMNVNGYYCVSCDSPVPLSQMRGSEYETMARRRRTSSWSLWLNRLESGFCESGFYLFIYEESLIFKIINTIIFF